MPFDEEASAQSFQEALTQWRAGHQEEKKQQSIHTAKPHQEENKKQNVHTAKPGMGIIQIFI